MALSSSLRRTAAHALRPRPARWKHPVHPARPPRLRRRPGSDVGATLGAVVAIVLCLATARWWSPLVSVPLGVATALLIRHTPLRGRRSRY